MNAQTFAADSPFGLKILQPAAGLDTSNRYYRAYPGLLYEVSVSAVGGAYPYKYEVSSNADISIEPTTGLLSWSVPENESGGHFVQVTVVDSSGNDATVSWEILVTKTGFLFVDAENGSSGATGSISDPLRSFEDVFGGSTYDAKYDDKFEGFFAYFKNGTYDVAGFSGDGEGVQYTFRKPVVLMAYPGHKPTLDMSRKYIHGDSRLDNLFVKGFRVTPISGGGDSRFGFRIPGNSNNVTFSDNDFRELDATSGSNNQSVIMIAKNDNRGSNWSIIGNTFSRIFHGYGVLGYTARDVLIANNDFHDFSDPTGSSSHPIGPKVDTTRWFIRKNTIRAATDVGIWLYYATEKFEFGEIEVSFNYVSMSSGVALSVNQKQARDGGSAYIFRNTFVGDVRFSNISSSFPKQFFSKNVIVNGSSGLSCKDCSDAPRIIESDNLMGRPEDGMIDSNGRLTAEWRNHEGSRGHFISDAEIQQILPNPPNVTE